MFRFLYTRVLLLVVSVVCGAPSLASGQIELPSPPTKERRIELPSPPSQERRIELPSPPTKKGRVELPSPSGRNGTLGDCLDDAILQMPVVTWDPCTGQNQVRYLAITEEGPRRPAPVYSYRRDPDVAYSESEIADRHNVRMTRRYLSDDSQWREQTVWVTADFAARHGYRPDVKMIRHYYDQSGNKREQTVYVTRDFAARWGYAPIKSGESTNSTVAIRGSRID